MLIAAIVVLSLAVRLPFYKPCIADWDALQYSQGALGHYVAHSPGYIGYCTLGMLLNKAVGSITRTYLAIDLLSALAAICLVWPLARRMGFSPRAAALAMIAFSFSIGMLNFSMRISTYAVEAMFATFIALAGLTAIQRRSGGWALAATAGWAIGGAFRPSTILLMAPLVVYAALKSDRRWRTLALHLLISVPIVAGWSRANNYFLAAQRGFQPATEPGGIEGKFVIPFYSGFDVSTMQFHRYSDAPLVYHWPMGELLRWLELKTGLNVVRKTVVWPEPSLNHAGRLIALNLVKLAFFFVLSLPAAMLVPLMWIWRRRLARPAPGVITFCAWWFVPSLLFYTFCHFAIGYLLVCLAGAVVLLLGMLADAQPPAQSPWPRRLLVAAMALSVAGLAVWWFGKPLRSGSKPAAVLNRIVLFYTAPALLQQAVLSDQPRSHPSTGASGRYRNLSTDDELLREMRGDNLFPNAVYKLPQPSR